MSYKDYPPLQMAAMTAPAYTVSPDRLAGEVLYEMLERGIRHAPVVSERGRLIGMLEDADLYAAQPRSWVRARRNIEICHPVDRSFASLGLRGEAGCAREQEDQTQGALA